MSYNKGILMPTVNDALKQIDDVLAMFQNMLALQQSRTPEHEDGIEELLQGAELEARLISTITRLSPPGSSYQSEIYQRPAKPHDLPRPILLMGLLRSLRTDYQNGYLSSFKELLHAEDAAGYLEMANNLLAHGYKDPSAVIGGSILEQHLRNLAVKHSIIVEINNKPKKADALNAELSGQSVYSKLDQKSITGWLGLRNEAAHGNYAKYETEQVAIMLNGITDFLTRQPA